MHLAWVSSQQGYQAIQVIQVFPQDLGKGNLSHRHHQPLPSPHQRSGPWSAAPSYLGIVCFLFLLEENAQTLAGLSGQERLREVGECEEGEPGVGLWGWTRKETQVMDCRGPRGGVGKPKKRETGAKGPNMQMYQHANVQRRYFNQLGVLSKREA